MTQHNLEGEPLPEHVWTKDPTRARAIREDPDMKAWHVVCASLVGKAASRQRAGNMAESRVYRHVAKVALNARELAYYAWLRREGLA